MRFDCLKCGHCCRNLLHKKYEIITGVSLTPEETGLFPQEHIFPSTGIGHYGRPKKIITYQLNLNTCPYLQEQRCTIYDRRPLACRAYPFEMEKVEPMRILIDENCRWFKEKVVAKGLTKKVLTYRKKIIAREEYEACWKLFQHGREFIESKNKWWFDLSRKAWFQTR